MSWPTAADYVEAVQNPSAAFADPELQCGCAEQDKFGLPRPRTGSFACVFKMQSKGYIHAVRCFLRESLDRQRRYLEIDHALQAARLPYTVDFRFDNRGIRIRGTWYPLLKMDWANGVTLDHFVRDNLGNPGVLLSLASKWVDMSQALKRAGIAHGDLQHGNVLIVNSELRLVDYDGMYVPRLSGCRSCETGHRHYQHPWRTDAHYGPYLDNFSAWVIYLSVVAISIQPALWQHFNGGDECLLFRHEDFEKPYDSQVFKELERSADERLRFVASILRPLVSLRPEDIPPLEAKRAPTRTPAGQSRGLAPLPEWLRDHVSAQGRTQPLDEPAAMPADTAGIGASWVQDWVSAPVPAQVGFVRTGGLERLLLLGVACGCVGTLLVGDAWLIDMAALDLLFWAALVLCRHRSDASVVERRRWSAELRKTTRKLDSLRASATALRNNAQTRVQAWKAQQAEFQARERSLAQKEANSVARTRASCEKRLSAIVSEQQVSHQRELTEVQALRARSEERTNALTGRAAELDAAERVDLQNALTAKREQHVLRHLTWFDVRSASLPGIGYALKMRLFAAGVRTAADVDLLGRRSVPGIGQARRQTIRTWHAEKKRQAQVSAPSQLLPGEAAAIQARYSGQRAAARSELARLRYELQAAEDHLRSQHSNHRRLLQQEEQSVRAEMAQALRQLHEEFVAKHYSLRRAFDFARRTHLQEMKSLSDSVAVVQGTVFSAEWEKARTVRQMGAYASLGLWFYVRMVILGRRR